jgi:large subunit ribosomal protein L17
MRHLREGRKLSRTASHRRALMRNLATALFERERIETTLAKAKETRRVAERLITYAKRGDLHSRRLVARDIQDAEIVKKLFDTIAPWYATRPGGYTRVLRTRARLGDAGEMAVLELVKSAEQKSADRRAREDAAKTKEKAKEAKAAKAEKEKDSKEPEDREKEVKGKHVDSREAKSKESRGLKRLGRAFGKGKRGGE